MLKYFHQLVASFVCFVFGIGQLEYGEFIRAAGKADHASWKTESPNETPKQHTNIWLQTKMAVSRK